MTPASVTGRICEAIKGRIAAGLYGPGARLPSTRALAVEWGVSRTTVTVAMTPAGASTAMSKSGRPKWRANSLTSGAS